MSVRRFLELFFLVWGIMFFGIPMAIYSSTREDLGFFMIFFVLGLMAIFASIYMLIQDIIARFFGENFTGIVVAIDEDSSCTMNGKSPVALVIGYIYSNGVLDYATVNTGDIVRAKYSVGDIATFSRYKNLTRFISCQKSMYMSEEAKRILEDYAQRSGAISGCECKSCGADVKLVNGYGVCEYCGEIIRINN